MAAVFGGVIAGCDEHPADRTPPADEPPAVAAPKELPPGLKQSLANVPNQPTYVFMKEVPAPRTTQAERPEPEASNDLGPSEAFARARLKILGKEGQRLTAVLYSDDPKEALSDQWTGDRYIFHMPLAGISQRAAIDGYVYRMRVSQDSEDETRDGIFRHGDEEHFEPVDLEIRFEIRDTRTIVWIGGLFKRVDPIRNETHWYQVQFIVPTALE